MTPVLSVIGRSNSGKTTLIEGLVRSLVSRGYRIGTIKHHFHGDFEVDREGKDSWRHAEAGAVAVALSSPVRLAVIRRVEGEAEVEEIARMLGEVDLVITEGFKKGPWPKVEVNRAARGGELMCRPEENLIAVVTDRALDIPPPCFGLESYDDIADFVEERFLRSVVKANPGNPASII